MPSAALRRVSGAENPEARSWGVWAFRFSREAESARPALSSDSFFISPLADGGSPGEVPAIPARREGWDRTTPVPSGPSHPAEKTAALVPPPVLLRLGDWHGLRLVDGVARPSAGVPSASRSLGGRSLPAALFTGYSHRSRVSRGEHKMLWRFTALTQDDEDQRT